MLQWHFPADPAEQYLEPTDVVDFDHPEVALLAHAVAGQDPEMTFRNAFETVRDRFPHTLDVGGKGVAVKASDVIRLGHGFCYAKTHLLAALLRANRLPTGFCYQKLTSERGGFVLHGLNAVQVNGQWVIADARGNNSRLSVAFDISGDMRAYHADTATGEKEYLQIYSRPAPNVVEALESTDDATKFLTREPGDLVR